MTPDPLPLAQALIRCASVTPADQGAQAVLASALEKLGFTVTHLPFGTTPNLFARIGDAGPHLCFAGHTDVVPAGTGWDGDPFAATVHEGILHGRGACDMKGGIAAFVAAVAAHLAQGARRGSLSFLITGDEEGPARDGTVRVLEWMQAHNQIPDFCLVGEPTNPTRMGEVIKIGRRGSMNARITLRGRQGHVAYPDRADNPVHRLLAALRDLTDARLDDGNEWFQPSCLQVTSVDVGNDATNLIPAEARARLNIRFNNIHRGAELENWLRQMIGAHSQDFDLHVSISGEAFLTQPGPAVDALRQSVRQSTGIDPRLDTGGGTSDARFIALYCPVAEFGLVGASMHRADEHVPVAELRQLAGIYNDFIARFLG